MARFGQLMIAQDKEQLINRSILCFAPSIGFLTSFCEHVIGAS